MPEHKEDALPQKDATNESLARTVESQALIIGQQYQALSDLGEKIYDMAKENREFIRAIMENLEVLPNHIKVLQEELSAMQEVFAEEAKKGTKYDQIHMNAMFAQFDVVKNKLEVMGTGIDNIKSSVDFSRRGYSYTEPKQSTFGPGGSGGYGE